MELWLLVAATAVFFGGAFVYLLFMVFLPEWVGITGKKAKEAEASHKGGTPAGPDFITRLQGDHGRIEPSSEGTQAQKTEPKDQTVSTRQDS